MNRAVAGSTKRTTQTCIGMLKERRNDDKNSYSKNCPRQTNTNEFHTRSIVAQGQLLSKSINLSNIINVYVRVKNFIKNLD